METPYCNIPFTRGAMTCCPAVTKNRFVAPAEAATRNAFSSCRRELLLRGLVTCKYRSLRLLGLAGRREPRQGPRRCLVVGVLISSASQPDVHLNGCRVPTH